jgi:hypothetical protein
MPRFMPHLAVFLLTCAGLIELAVNGFSFESPCDPGFGARHAAAKEKYLRRLFVEPLPQQIQLLSFECGGFQDKYVNATFRVAAPDARLILAGLNKRFDAVDNDRHVPDKDKKRSVLTYPDRKKTSFVLPAPRGFHFREVSVTVPRSDAGPATVEFSVQQS